MTTFTLTINLGNDAMQSPADLSSALADLSSAMLQGAAGDPYEAITVGPSTRISGNVYDDNGNRVGSWGIK